MKNNSLEAVTVVAASAAANVITWTANEPTAANTQTIADGTVPTVAELGQSVQDLTTTLNALIADVASIRSLANA